MRVGFAKSALVGLLMGLCSCTDLSYDPKADGGTALIDSDAMTAGMGGSSGAGSSASGRGGSGGAAGASGRGGMGGTGGMAGSTGPEAGTGPQLNGDGCDQEGLLRCVDNGSVAREKCEDGVFVESDACAEGEICDTSMDAEPGACISLFELCIGHANEAVCVGPDMHHCNADAVSTTVETCESERHCLAGASSATCAVCLEGTFHCDSANLQACASDGMGWVADMTCDTPELCNEISGACTDSACLPNDKTCDDDELLRCKADQSGFEHDSDCGAGLCDLAGEECDTCVPGTRVCNTGNTGFRVCSQDGHGYTDTACDDEAPECTGAGTCVQCTTPSDCEETNPCKNALCNAGNCGSSNKSSGVCPLNGGGNGVCDGGGNCVECVGAGNCTSGAPYCVSNVCRPCNGTCAVAHSCGEDSDCASGDCTGSLCRPSCSGSCAVGDQCAADGDCASGDCDSGTCTKICDDVTLDSQEDFDAAQDCARINGNLTIAWSSVVHDIELPNVTAITGDISVTYNTLNNNPMTALRLPLLETIGGSVLLAATALGSINWPELTSIGGQINMLASPNLTTVTMQKLETIGGLVQFGQAPEMTRIDMRGLQTITSGGISIFTAYALNRAYFTSIQSVAGMVSLQTIPFLSYSDVSPLWDNSNQSGGDPFEVGCCLFGPTVTKAGCDEFDVTACSSL